MYGLKTESTFDAAHFLSHYGGKCENLHGHRWRVVAYLSAKKLHTDRQNEGMVVDFGTFKQALRKLTRAWDHTFIVENGSLAPETIACLEAESFHLTFVAFRTTAENMAHYFAEQLLAQGLPVSRVDVYETPTNCATYFVETAETVEAAEAAETAEITHL